MYRDFSALYVLKPVLMFMNDENALAKPSTESMSGLFGLTSTENSSFSFPSQATPSIGSLSSISFMSKSLPKSLQKSFLSTVITGI